MALAESAGWALPHADICWVSERHHILNRDERGRLHSVTGPAVMYPDGWAIYAMHGVRVSEWIITKPHEITISKVLGEPNAEIRHVMMERMGQENFLAQSKAQPIHKDRRGELYRIDLRGDEPFVVVRVLNSTPELDGTHKSYVLRVPPTVRTATEAVAWTFGLSLESYQPTVES
jgi:hypothetical protein